LGSFASTCSVEKKREKEEKKKKRREKNGLVSRKGKFNFKIHSKKGNLIWGRAGRNRDFLKRS